jgi:hypothetical protein
MFRLLYTLVLLVRAGRAWRNSPNFSIVALLKVAGVTISGITVLIGAIILLMQMDIGNGPLVIGLVLGIVVVTTAFLIASIMWLTNGMGPKPASGTKPVRMNRAKLDRWTHGAAGALAVSIAAIWVVPDWLQAMPIGIAAVLGLACVAALMPLYLVAWRTDRLVGALLAAPWLHWHYTDETWFAWAAACEEAERKASPPQTFRSFGLIMGFVALLFAIGAATVDGPISERIGIVLGLTFFIALVILIVSWMSARQPARRYRRLIVAPRDVYIGPDGVLVGNEFLAFLQDSHYLVDARLQNAKTGPELVMRFVRSVGLSQVPVEKPIPVPPNAIDGMGDLETKLRARCSRATTRLVAAA